MRELLWLLQVLSSVHYLQVGLSSNTNLSRKKSFLKRYKHQFDSSAYKCTFNSLKVDLVSMEHPIFLFSLPER